MELMNTSASVVSLVYSIVTMELFEFSNYCAEYPDILFKLGIMGLLGATGQVFIFYTIASFSPLILSIVTSVRKFLTVICSILYYSHPINDKQKLAIALVFGGIALEMMLGKKKKEEKRICQGR